MKRLIIIICIAFVILLSATAVKTVNTTTVINTAEICLSNPESSLISIIPSISDSPGFFRQGEKQKDLLEIRNNMNDAISYDLVYENSQIFDFVKIETLINPNLSSGDKDNLKISIDNFSPIGIFTLGLCLSSEWPTGNARIYSDILIEIREGDLIIDYKEGLLNVTWNGGPQPPKTELFYRYNDLISGWGSWEKLGNIENIQSGLPGLYEIKAAVGKTFSNVVEIDVEIKEENTIVPEESEGKESGEDMADNT